MQTLVKQQGMGKEIYCDSAGTLDYHCGKTADARMQKHARLRGYELNSISRPFEYDDFELFDWIITMDEDNYQQIKWFDQSINYADKIRRMTEFCKTAQVLEVPDPYYGGVDGFSRVLDLIEKGSRSFLKAVQARSGEI
mgnify:CR=1 FL=1